MIGFFTDPYPDEILYSAVARYHHRAKNRKSITTTRDLFGKNNFRLMVDFPSNINNLLERLPLSHLYTADKIIDENTLYPFHSPFLPLERKAKIREYMKSSNRGSHIYLLLGLLTNSITLKNLRYCPVCVEEDRKNYGETYWHRIHQIPGIICCSKHQTFLNEACCHPREITDRNSYFVVAEQLVNYSSVYLINSNNFDDLVHLHLARDITWLSENCKVESDVLSLNSRFKHLLFNLSLATFEGTISKAKVKQKFIETYSEKLLQQISCEFKTKWTWIDRLFTEPETSQHPIRYLLIIHLLGHSLKTFLKIPVKPAPFGKSPFPCLNPAASHFQQDVIEKISITTKPRSNGDISATFYCECGFIYRRFGHDEQGKKRFTYDRIVEFGNVWDEALKQAFKSKFFDSKKLAQRFGVPKRTLSRQIARLNLSCKYNFLKPKKRGRAKTTLSDIKKNRKRYREEWLRLQTENPFLGRYNLRKLNGPLYTWLYGFDNKWLNSHLPNLKYSKTTRIDWEKRDLETAQQIEYLANELKNSPGKPVYVSITLLRKKLKIKNDLARPQLVPKTIEALKTHSETFEQYAVRKIEWGLQNLAGNGKSLSKDAFSKAINSSQKYLESNQLLNTKFEEALERINFK